MNDKRMTEVSRKWSSSGVNLDAAESEARRLEKKGTFAATMDEEAGTVTLSKDDFKSVMGKLGTHKRTAKTAKKNVLLLAFGYLAVTIGFIAVIVGLVNWRLEATKESHVTDSQLVGRDGTIVETASVVSYTQLFDLPYFDMTTISKVKDVVITLLDGREFALTISRASKSAGSTRLQLEDANGNGLDIDSCSLLALAKIDGKTFPLKGMTQEVRKLAGASSPALYSTSEYAALKSEQRQLGIGSADIGTIALAMRHTEAVLDSAEGYHAPKNWESAYIESEGLTVMTDVPVVYTKIMTFAERLDGETQYIIGAWNGIWYMYIDTTTNQIRHFQLNTGRTICLPADDHLNEYITKDRTLTTPIAKSCNEDGYITKEHTPKGTFLTRTTSVDYDSVAVMNMANIRVILPIECNMDMMWRDHHQQKLYNVTHNELVDDIVNDAECTHEMYMRGEECEDPIGFTEAMEAGRNLEEDIAAFENAVTASNEGRNLRLGHDEIRGGHDLKGKSKRRGGFIPRPGIDKSGGGGGISSDEIRPGSGGAGKRYREREHQPFPGHGSCGGYGKAAAYSPFRLGSAYNTPSGRQLLYVNPAGAGGSSYLQQNWYCEILKHYDGPHDALLGANAERYIANGHQGRLQRWREIFNRNAGFMQHNAFNQNQEVWLTHIPNCMSGRKKPSDCGEVALDGPGSDIIGYGSSPQWGNWVECQGWGARGGICYAYPVIVLMHAGMGWTPATRSKLAAIAHAIWDAFLAAFLGQIPFPYRGTPRTGGLKLHTGGTVLYVWFIEGCLTHHLSWVQNKWGKVSYNVGMSLGNAAVVIYSQWKTAKFGTVVWGGYPTCFGSNGATSWLTERVSISVLGKQGWQPEMADYDPFNLGDFDNDSNERDNNGLGDRAMEFVDNSVSSGSLAGFFYRCGDLQGQRYAMGWDSITGGGEIMGPVFKSFKHDVQNAYRMPASCRYGLSGAYDGNDFAVWAIKALAYGIIGNAVILVINKVILPIISALCIDRIAKWWGGDCSFPEIEYINPYKWCIPQIERAGSNYSGGGLFEGVRWELSSDNPRNMEYSAAAQTLGNVMSGALINAVGWFVDAFLGVLGLGFYLPLLHNVVYVTVLDFICDVIQFKIFHQGNWYAKAHHNNAGSNYGFDRYWDGDDDQGWLSTD